LPEKTRGVRADTHRTRNSQRTLEAQGPFNRRLSRETWGAPGRTSSSWPTASFTRNRRIQSYFSHRPERDLLQFSRSPADCQANALALNGIGCGKFKIAEMFSGATIRCSPQF